MLTIHEYVLSAECYAVRLLAKTLDVAFESRQVEIHPSRMHEQEPFISLNPLSTVPVLETGTETIRDWQAILVYLAAMHDRSGNWLPLAEPRRLAGVFEFLAMARALGETAGAARLHDAMGISADITRCRRDAHRLLRVLDSHLWFGEQQKRLWLVQGDHPTVADIAVFVHVVLSEEGDISREDYPAVRRWLDRCRRLDGFIVMSGVFEPPAGLSLMT